LPLKSVSKWARISADWTCASPLMQRACPRVWQYLFRAAGSRLSEATTGQQNLPLATPRASAACAGITVTPLAEKEKSVPFFQNTSRLGATPGL
jgi:hypothetical protein